VKGRKLAIVLMNVRYGAKIASIDNEDDATLGTTYHLSMDNISLT
jgi:hypothetical protein